MSSEPRHLHPAEVVFAAGEALRELVVPIVVGAVLGSGSGSGGLGFLIAIGGAIASIAMAAARWRRTTYTVTPTELSFRSGVLSPDDVVVPVPRIASVDVVQGPVQRLFGVVELQVHVAGGGGDPEVRLRAVSREDAAALQAVLGHTAEAPVAPVFRLTPRRLVVAALTAPQIGLLLPVAGAAGAFLQPALQNGEGERLAERAARSPGTVAIAVVGLVVAAALLSVAGAVVAFAGFEVRVQDGRLQIRRGLLQRRAASLPLDRVHAVAVLEPPVRQPFGLVSVRLETAGYRGQARATRTLLPVATRAEADAVLRAVVPELAGGVTALARPPRRAARRYVLRPAAAALVPGAVVALLVPAAWPVVPVLVLAGAGLGLLRFADAGWALEGPRVTFRHRSVGRRTLVARRARLQDHELRQTPLQRRAGLAAVRAAVGSGAHGGVAQLDAREAARLYAALRPAAARNA